MNIEQLKDNYYNNLEEEEYKIDFSDLDDVLNALTVSQLIEVINSNNFKAHELLFELCNSLYFKDYLCKEDILPIFKGACKKKSFKQYIKPIIKDWELCNHEEKRDIEFLFINLISEICEDKEDLKYEVIEFVKMKGYIE